MRRLLAFAFLFTTLEFGQATDPRTRLDKVAKKALPTPKELARQLLDSAYSSVGSATPGAQPFLLWRIGDCYTLLDKKKAAEILNQAFTEAGATQAFANPGPGVQGQIAVAMADLDVARAAEMVRAIPGSGTSHVWSYDPRATAVNNIVGRMLSKHDINSAIELANSLGSDGAYPFDAVGSILGSLESEDDPRRVIVFGNALTAYQTRPARGFGQLVAGNWRKLPRASVILALDSIVNTVLAYKPAESTYKITYTGKNGSAELPTEQDVELFDIVEPLNACEPAKAQEIFDTHASLKHAAGDFPRGVNWEDIGGMQMSMTLPGESPKIQQSDSGKQAAFAAGVMRERQVEAAASHDLQAGIAMLPGITDLDTRASAMLTIAMNHTADFPAIARDLTRRAIAVLADSKNPDQESQLLDRAFEIALKLRDEALTHDALAGSFEAAARLYKVDADLEDPNVMPVDMWPSTNGYRRSIGEAEKLYNIRAVSYLDRIRNPDMLIFSEVALAAALLNRHFDDTKSSVHLKQTKQ